MWVLGGSGDVCGCWVGQVMCVGAGWVIKLCPSILQLERFSEQLTSASIVVVDSNIPQESIKFVCDTCWLAGVPGGCGFVAMVPGRRGFVWILLCGY